MAKILRLRCLAGHTWEWEARAGQTPEFCPDHAEFADSNKFPPRLKPAQMIKERWEVAGEEVGDPNYVKTWNRRWGSVVRTVAALRGDFRLVEYDEVEEYVRHWRLSEFHSLVAQNTPYLVTPAGVTRAHPGWVLSIEEARLTKRWAKKLGLEVPLGSGDEEAPRGPEPESPGDGPAIIDDQVGPDGEPL